MAPAVARVEAPPAPPKERDPDAEFNDLVRQGQRANKGEKFKAAVGTFRKALAMKPDSLDAKGGLGIALVNTDPGEAGYREAIKLLQEVVRGQPSNARAWVSLGMAYQFTDSNSQAKAAYQKYLEIEPRGALAQDVKAMLDGL